MAKTGVSWDVWQCSLHWFWFAQPRHHRTIDTLRLMATDDFGNLFEVKTGGAASHFITAQDI